MVVRVSGRVGAFEVLVREETGGKFRFQTQSAVLGSDYEMSRSAQTLKARRKVTLTKALYFQAFLTFP
jgi:hypothetical protein